MVKECRETRGSQAKFIVDIWKTIKENESNMVKKRNTGCVFVCVIINEQSMRVGKKSKKLKKSGVGKRS